MINRTIIELAKRRLPSAKFYTSQDGEIQTIQIKIENVAECVLYFYFDDKSTVYLSNLKVNSEFTNKGIGTKLQEVREQIGRELSATYTCLCVERDSWMFDWYIRRGYEYLKEHEQEEFVWMIKNI